VAGAGVGVGEGGVGDLDEVGHLELAKCANRDILVCEDCPMPTRNVSLTDHYDDFIEAGVKSGRFSNASEVVRVGLSLLEQRDKEYEARLAWLRGATQEAFDALDRGEGITLSSDEEIDDFVNQAIAEGRAARNAANGRT
jgi:antitoxin ParD1/3/4